jgi:hypothetical protein
MVLLSVVGGLRYRRAGEFLGCRRVAHRRWRWVAPVSGERGRARREDGVTGTGRPGPDAAGATGPVPAGAQAIEDDLAAIAAIADPYERERAARAAIELHRGAMARFAQLRVEIVSGLLAERTGRAEEVAARMGVSREWLYAVAAAHRPGRKR